MSPHLLAPIPAEGLNYLEVIQHAGWVELGVLGLLLFASVASWAIIARKYLHLRKAQRESVKFLETFWQSRRLDQIFEGAEKMAQSPLSQVFRAGYIELSKLTQAPKGGEGSDTALREQFGGIENVERALKRAQSAELTSLESSVAFLGTTASAAPFVGLFGTVWGIMNAFSDIYSQGNANLATVAQPISHALIATAFGLAAAIPAVVAYNSFLSKIKVLDSEMANFSSDFLNIVKRHFFK
jgi:biopolymer transport protein TolQ